MNYKTPFILVLIGVILGGITSAWKIISYFIAKAIMGSMGSIYGSFNLFGFDYSSLLLLSLIRGIIGLIVTIILAFYLLRISKFPTNTDFIVTIVLGALGIVGGMGFVAGVLTLVGRIVGVMQFNKENVSLTPPKSKKSATKKK